MSSRYGCSVVKYFLGCKPLQAKNMRSGCVHAQASEAAVAAASSMQGPGETIHRKASPKLFATRGRLTAVDESRTSVFYVDRNGDLNRFSGSFAPETIRHDTEVYFWEPPVPDSPVLGDHLVCIVRDPDSNGTEIWLLGPNSCRRIVSYGGSANVINLSLLGLTDHTILVSRSASGHTNPNGPKDREHFLDIITLPESCLDE